MMVPPGTLRNPQVDTGPMGQSQFQSQIAPQQLMSGQVARSAIPVGPQGASDVALQAAQSMNSARNMQQQGVSAGVAASLEGEQGYLPTQSERLLNILTRHRVRAIEAMGGAPNIAVLGGVMKQALADARARG